MRSALFIAKAAQIVDQANFGGSDGMEAYDYIVVGAGSAGCVLATRLSEERNATVLLLEAGIADCHPLLPVPFACGLFFYNPAFTWGFLSEPEPFADQRTIAAVASKVTGGGSSINGMIYSRGDPSDYDHWAELGATGWSYDEVLPYFKRSEDNWRGMTSAHGAGGPLGVSPMARDDIYERVIQTARNKALPVKEDFEAGAIEGFGAPDITVHNGRRSSTSRKFLQPALDRRNLTLRTGAQIANIIIEKGRAVGVRYIQDGKLITVQADQEVLLSAGTFNSPKILMLSGIGPADHLAEMNVPIACNLPGVGQNLQEHPGVPVAFKAAIPLRFDETLRLDRLTIAMARWAVAKSGPVAQPPCSAFGFLKSRAGLDVADIEWTFVGAYNDTRIWFPGWRKRGQGVVNVANILLRPESRGVVTLRSSDPAAPPRVQFNFLQAVSDRDTLVRSIRMTRDFMASHPAREMVRGEVAPGDSSLSDEDLHHYIRQNVFSNIHATSTCTMGADGNSVVDPELKVHGVSGLRVVDASVMPAIPSGHTNAPTIMIAERAADLILGESR